MTFDESSNMVNMTMFLRKFLPVLVVILFVFLLFPKLVLASSLSLSPTKRTVAVGETVSAQVRLNTGSEAVNAVSAFLSYPADKLEVAWISYPSSAFSISAEGSFGGGIIKISRGNINPVSGNLRVATIGFKGKVAGSATVAFIGGSAAPRASDSSDSLNLGASSGTVFQVGGTAPKPATKPKQPQREQLKISEIKISLVATDSATVSWKTSSKADSYIEYGLDKDIYVLSASNQDLVTDHSLILQNSLLLPGVVFHFRIKSRDSGGNLAVSEDQTFQLLGYTVKLKLTDTQGNPLKNTEVLLYSDPQKGMTDENGEVIFPNVTMGKHRVVVKQAGVEKTGEINVVDAPSPQQFNLNIDNLSSSIQTPFRKVPQSNRTLYLIVGGGVLIVVLIGIVYVLIRKRGKSDLPKDNFPTNPPPPPPPTMMAPMDPNSPV